MALEDVVPVFEPLVAEPAEHAYDRNHAPGGGKKTPTVIFSLESIGVPEPSRLRLFRIVAASAVPSVTRAKGNKIPDLEPETQAHHFRNQAATASKSLLALRRRPSVAVTRRPTAGRIITAWMVLRRRVGIAGLTLGLAHGTNLPFSYRLPPLNAASKLLRRNWRRGLSRGDVKGPST